MSRSSGGDSDFAGLLAAVAAAPARMIRGAPPWQPGTRVADRFVIERVLGAGGMGVVFAATDSRLQRRIAVKVINDAARPGAIERFRREAQAMAALAHPNIVEVFDAGVHEGLPFIAMELVDGSSLRDWQLEQRDQEALLEAYRAAGRGLAAAHAAGVIHRDFKPDNVLVADGAAIKVADFGLAALRDLPAKVSGDGSQTPEQTGAVGTPAYAAPEQMATQTVDASADQFAFCVALWEALTLRPPFPAGPTRYLAIVEGRFARPADEDMIPKRIRAALRRGLQAVPSKRFPSMDALLVALSRSRPKRGWIFGGLASVALLAGVVVAELGAAGPCEQPSPLRDEVAAHLNSGQWLDAAGQEQRELLAAPAGQLASVAHARLVDHDLVRASVCASGGDPTGLECLASRLQTLDRVVRQVETVPGLLLSRGSDLRAALPDFKTCRDERAEAAEDPRIAALRSRAQAVNVAAMLGAPSPAAAELESVAETAGELGAPRLQARLTYEAAVLRRKAGEFERCGELAEDAYQLARDDRLATLAVEALTERVTCGRSFALTARETERWAAALEATLRDTAVPPEYAGEALQALGSVAADQHDIETARDHFEAAVRSFAESPMPWRGAVAASDLAYMYLRLGDFSAALAQAREAVSLARSDPLADPGTLIHAEGSLVGLLLLTGNDPAETLPIIDRALTFVKARRLKAYATPLHVRRAHILWAMERFPEALEAVRDARRAAVTKESSDVAESYALEGHIEGALGNTEASIAAYERSIVLYEQLGAHAKNAVTRINLGVTHAQAGNHEAAVRNYRRAIAEMSATEGSDTLASARMNLGESLLQLGKPAEAIEPLERAIETFDGLPEYDPVWRILCRIVLGDALLQEGREAEARKVLQAAVADVGFPKVSDDDQQRAHDMLEKTR